MKMHIAKCIESHCLNQYLPLEIFNPSTVNIESALYICMQLSSPFRFCISDQQYFQYHSTNAKRQLICKNRM